MFTFKYTFAQDQFHPFLEEFNYLLNVMAKKKYKEKRLTLIEGRKTHCQYSFIRFLLSPDQLAHYPNSIVHTKVCVLCISRLLIKCIDCITVA